MNVMVSSWKKPFILHVFLIFTSFLLFLPYASAYSKTDISGNTITTENIYTNQIESYFDSSPCGSDQAVKRIYANGSYVCGYSASSLSTTLSIGNSAGSNNLDMSQQDVTNLRNLFFNSGTAYLVQNSDGNPIYIQGDDSGGTRQDLLSLNPNGPNLTLHGNDLDSIGNVTVSGDMGITGGKIGIGTEKPSVKFHVEGSGGTDINFSNTGNNRYMTFSSSGGEIDLYNGMLHLNENSGTDLSLGVGGGNVGIGTISPGSSLDVRTNSTTVYDPDTLDWTTIGPDALKIRNDYDGQSGEVFTGLFIETNGPGRASARLSLLNQGSGAGSLIFGLRSNQHTDYIKEKMRLTHNGRLGIGTTNPNTIFHIEDSGDYSATDLSNNRNIVLEGFGNNDGGGFYWLSRNGKDAARIVTENSGSYNKQDIIFYTNDASDYTSSATEAMRIKSDGKVGIGTTTPSTVLEINPQDASTGAYPSWIDGSESQGIFFRAGSDNAFIGMKNRGGGTDGNEWNTAIYFGDDTSDDLEFYSEDNGLDYYFEPGGNAYADSGWNTFSPYIAVHFALNNKSNYQVGDLVSVEDEKAVRTSERYENNVVGVVSPAKGFISLPDELESKLMNSSSAKDIEDFNVVYVAYLGNVQVKVNDEGGAIEPGDLLVPSSEKGVAMKGNISSFEEYSSAIGKARESFNGRKENVAVSLGVK